MPYLLDTNVISETRKPKPDPNALAWLRATPNEELRLSVLVIGEVRNGVERKRRDPVQARRLEAWLRRLRRDFAYQIVPVTMDVAEIWGEMNYPDPLPLVDGLMAATAITYGWTFVTRNIADVERTGVDILNPFEPLNQS